MDMSLFDKLESKATTVQRGQAAPEIEPWPADVPIPDSVLALTEQCVKDNAMHRIPVTTQDKRKQYQSAFHAAVQKLYPTMQLSVRDKLNKETGDLESITISIGRKTGRKKTESTED
jgi:hypothetical protein